MSALTINCIVADDANVTVFAVKPTRTDTILTLHQLILDQGVRTSAQVKSQDLIDNPLEGGANAYFILPREPLSIPPHRTLGERLRHRGSNPADFADELNEPSFQVAHYFPQVENSNLHLIVVVPPPELKRTASSSFHDSIDEQPLKYIRYEKDIIALHGIFWKSGAENFKQRTARIPDPLSLEVDNNSEELQVTVIEHPDPRQTFPSGERRIIVPEIYKIFKDILAADDEEWQKILESETVYNPFLKIFHATIITGQPGIGKSVLLEVILLDRLVAGQTTVFCDEPTHAYVFNDVGARLVSLSGGLRIPELMIDPHCCALVNLGDRLAEVPLAFYPADRKGRVILASLPDQSHWKRFSREHPAKTICMPTWNWSTLYVASLVTTGQPSSCWTEPCLEHCQRLQKAYTMFRGIPRSCFQPLNEPGLQEQLLLIKSAIDDIASIDSFMQATVGQVPFNMTASHRLVRVEPIDTQWRKTHTVLLSDHVAELVFERIRLVTKAQLFATLCHHIADPVSRAKAGKLFELAAHFFIRKGITLTLTALSGTSTSDVLTVPSIQGDDAKNSRYYTLDILAELHSKSVKKDFLDLYMTPISKPETAIDAIFISRDYVTYLFQMTIYDKHSISFRGLAEIFSILPAKALKDVRFVFVKPSHALGRSFQGIKSAQPITVPVSAADAEQLKKFQELPQYVCQWNIDTVGGGGEYECS